MWDHAADGLVENAAGCSEMEGTTSCGIVSGDLAEVGMVLHCCLMVSPLVSCPDHGRSHCRHTFGTEELPRDVEGFGSHNHDLLAIEKLLCDCAGKTTKQMPFAINHNLEKRLMSVSIRSHLAARRWWWTSGKSS